MEEEEAIFDPTMKKKKKSKKPFDMSVLEGNDGEKKETQEIKDTEQSNNDDKDLQDLNDFSGLKKKKKNKKTFNLEDLENALPADKENLENGSKSLSPADKAADNEADVVEDDLDFDFTKKKKKKKKAVNFEGLENADDADGTAGQEGADNVDGSQVSSSLVGNDSSKKWLDSDRDYTYDELLEIVFNIIKEKNPEIESGTKKKFVMRPPQVLRVGTKKTSFANFLEICKSLHRQPKHMQAFLLTELGTSGSVDANNQLIIKGRFQQKQIESVLRRYIKEYVACQTCRSPETILQKETRLFFLQCETCGSRRSVTNIKSGFQAVTGKRAAIRAKTT
ncbi:eukaryotic translation initiation factor 2 subunit 2-like [Oppia nitens]|uniref:eukaryotic translation initiation factor 2 subunit 2-like n=1 Tax=Oppia nitens TaxID=1686743 RepID=UPI0023DA1FBD|nr:eukaryotic translation initiation factor 2 subunit 2-like [Oppia nitens]